MDAWMSGQMSGWVSHRRQMQEKVDQRMVK